MVHTMFDPFLRNSYLYSTDSAQEELLYTILQKALDDECPDRKADYLCGGANLDAFEADDICTRCYSRLIARADGCNTPKAERLRQALEQAIKDIDDRDCPSGTENMLCKRTEDESTDISTCAACYLRWATAPFGQYKTKR